MQATDDLVELVHDALDHLYDYPYLQCHPLADFLRIPGELAPRERMRVLRTRILRGIEDLNPGRSVAYRAPQARAYNALNLRYVAGMTIRAVAKDLAISERQLYRDLRKAEMDLAALLSTRHEAILSVGIGATSHEELVLREAQRMEGNREEVSVPELFQGAIIAVERLGGQLGLEVKATIPQAPRVILTDRALARQVLVNALSCALQCAIAGTTVSMMGQSLGDRLRVCISYASHERLRAPEMMTTAEHLVRHLGGQWSAASETSGRVTVSFTFGEPAQSTVLVIDDNEGLHELFRRYLADEDYRLFVSSDAEEGLALAREIQPDIILLDVMMPRQDGWEVLQAIRNREDTCQIPVIVCSVLRDPQLAASLGATVLLPKPVNRTQLLEALARCQARAGQ